MRELHRLQLSPRIHGPGPESLRKPGLAEVSAILAGHALFRDMHPGPVGRIAAGTLFIEAPCGNVLFRRGDPCSGFHIVVHGQIKLFLHGKSGTEKVIELPGTGQSFGEAVMFLDAPYSVSAEAIADTRLLHVAKSAVFAELDRDPLLARRIIAGLSARLHHMVREIEMQTLHSGTQRLASYLLGLVDPRDKTSAHIELPARKNVIASRLNLTHEHFSRLLHALTADGTIELQGARIFIPNLTALRKCCL
ncbi:MAG: Crp/Fnr family transcriptional regulator [Burkholderiales bacterium]